MQDPNRLKFEERRTKRYTNNLRRALPLGLEKRLDKLKLLINVRKDSEEEGKTQTEGPKTPRAISPVNVRIRAHED